ncbi:hypothetical protein G6F50_013896 [Rhizopus delemar]|uniref:Signal transduction histidine kinase osmosensitive K+ channel sensor N-terminal domain-containing protein n=1 Tax=Rhizopus delemar TaxID=936053 RepID=A0A9P7CAJ6_9FUNG|nr:hypothetical protein G6F50_013896 [Rhizopus delemar]
MAAMTAAPMTDARTRQADALVEGLQREAGGKLTVFLGAAPGVGKTYTMLTRAQEQLRRGVDLVVGLVETHGRADTQARWTWTPCWPGIPHWCWWTNWPIATRRAAATSGAGRM